MINIFKKTQNRQMAVEMTDCALRLDWWIDKFAKDPKKKDELKFQAGKLYAYTYFITKLEYGQFAPDGFDVYGCEPLLKTAWNLSTGEMDINIFVEKEVIADAFMLMHPETRKEIQDYRENRYVKSKVEKNNARI